MICRAGTSLGFGEHPPDQAEDEGVWRRRGRRPLAPVLTLAATRGRRGGQGPAAPIITHYYALNNISEYCPYRDLFVGLQSTLSPSIKYMHCTIYIYTRTTKLATQLRWEILYVLVSSNLPVWKFKSFFYFIYELFELLAT